MLRVRQKHLACRTRSLHVHIKVSLPVSFVVMAAQRSEFVCPSAERALPWPLVCIIIYLFQSIVFIETGSEGISGKISVFGKIEYYVKKKVRCFRWYRLTTSTLMRRQTGGGSGRTRNVRSLAICIYLLHSNMYLVNRPFVKASQSSR